METRDAGFNIMLATDSYKVPSPPGFRGWGGEKEGVPLRKGLRDGSGGESQGGFITSPKANTVQLHSVTGSRRAEGGSKKRWGGETRWRRLRVKFEPRFASLCYPG